MPRTPPPRPPKGHPSPNKGKRFRAEVLTRDEVEALLRQCSHRSPSGIRNRALIGLLYRSGLRISEALALRPQDVDRDAGSIRVHFGKGGKTRVVGIDHGALALIDAWQAVRPRKRGAPLFTTLQGRPVEAGYVRKLLARLAERAGIERRVTPHCLRHTMAHELVREGVAMPLIQGQLGHSSLATTARYLRSIGAPEVVAAMARRSWAST